MDLVDDFERDGAVVLRGVVSAAEVESLRRGIDEVIAGPGPRAKVASAADDPGYFLEDFCTWRDHPDFESFVRTTELARVAADLMRSSAVTMYHDHVLVKTAGTRQRTPWHQDQPYYDVEGRQNVSFWIPVDPVPEDTCLELIAGSHRGPWLMPRSFLDGRAKWFPEGSLAEMPDYEAERDRHRILRWTLEPGDCIAFHMLTVHGAPGVRGERPRRVFSLRVLGDDCVFAPRDWATSPDMTEVFAGNDLRRPGERLDGEWFPRLWPVGIDGPSP
jgi:ectoine hydroxylase-related dioxygenase (phytanoyl-CoA dioxygenase family)